MTASSVPTQTRFFDRPPALPEPVPPRYQKTMEGDIELQDLNEANSQLAQEYHQLRHQIQIDLICAESERRIAQRRAERNRRKREEEAECTIHWAKMVALWFVWFALIAAAVIIVTYIIKYISSS
ncbi:hypothetical protein V496_06023 [Pseudogymnoascus sp. VKM F-4515 (FW-2607)]|nr:hypothetical protein V496_06023 [Pseudogymnoascus sp. VKM F-4515 (FW-2607)]KFY99962.1 hypothetical protein V498_00368 [Pseudogymnoascus sp. VKM F-4517 (FW-2822)]